MMSNNVSAQVLALWTHPQAALLGARSSDLRYSVWYLLEEEGLQGRL